MGNITVAIAIVGAVFGMNDQSRRAGPITGAMRGRATTLLWKPSGSGELGRLHLEEEVDVCRNVLANLPERLQLPQSR